jgi:hypothetical protein
MCSSFYGADDEARTRYLHLGKVALYQMSYARMERKKFYQMKKVLSREKETILRTDGALPMSFRAARRIRGDDGVCLRMWDSSLRSE